MSTNRYWTIRHWTGCSVSVYLDVVRCSTEARGTKRIVFCTDWLTCEHVTQYCSNRAYTYFHMLPDLSLLCELICLLMIKLNEYLTNYICFSMYMQGSRSQVANHVSLNIMESIKSIKASTFQIRNAMHCAHIMCHTCKLQDIAIKNLPCFDQQ